MSDDSKLDFVLDLDAQAFLQKAGSAIDAVSSLGTTLEALGSVAGIAGAAFLAIKTAADLTENAEDLKSLNAQFEILANQAGLVPEKLRAGLDKAAEGLIDDNELLQIANRNMVVLGDSAGRITEIMEIARKASVISGRDIKQVFEQIVQATASGRTQTLRELGIFVDSKKAVEDFAKAHGLAVNSLSETGKRQAILNAALESAKSSYASTDTSIKQVTDSWTRMKNAVNDLYDVISLGFDRVFSPTIKRMIDEFAKFATLTKNLGLSVLGTEAQKAAANVDLLKTRIQDLQGPVDQFDKTGQAFIEGTLRFANRAGDQAAVAAVRRRIEAMKAELEKGQVQLDKAASPSSATKGTPRVKDNIADTEAIKRNEAAFNKEIASLADQNLQIRKTMAQSDKEVDQQAAEQRVLIAQQTKAKIAEINGNQNLTVSQKQKEIELIQKQSAAKQLQIEQDLQKRKIAALDLYTTHAKSDADGVARAFESGSKKAQIAQKDFGAVGTRVFNSFQKTATSALQAFGAGQQSASEAAKGFIFGMLADEAEARGSIMLLASIFPPNPAGLAAGAGLVALSGFLRSQASTSSAGIGGGGISGGGGGASGLSGGGNDVSSFQQNQPQKAVTINIAGSYFETDQTKQRLVEMINETADATGYTVRQV